MFHRIDLEGFDIEDKPTRMYGPILHLRKGKEYNNFFKALARAALHLLQAESESGKQYEFVSLVKVTKSLCSEYYLTFTARLKDAPSDAKKKDVLKTIQAILRYMDDISEIYFHSRPDVILCRIKPAAAPSPATKKRKIGMELGPAKRRRISQGDGYHDHVDDDASMDRISRLPESILQHILCFLDQKRAVKTCALSKAWRYLWCTRPKFLFDERDASLSVLKRALRLYRRHHLSLLELTIMFSVADDTRFLLLNKWIPILVNKKKNMGLIKSFDLSFLGGQKSSRKYELPLVLFESESLDNLSLRGCILNPTSPSTVPMFKHLQKLRLSNVYISDQILDNLLSNSCVKDVALLHCSGFKKIKLFNNKPTNLKDFCFDDCHINGVIPIEMDDNIPTLRAFAISNCLLSVDHNQLLHFSHLTRLKMKYVKLSSKVFSCSLPCVEEFTLHYCEGISEFNLSSSSMKSLVINNPNRPFKATIDAPSIVSFCYEGILPQSIYFATTPNDWKSKIDLTFFYEPSHSFNELNGLLEALSQSDEISLKLDQSQIHLLWNQLHTDGSANIVRVSECKLALVVDHLMIKHSWSKPYSSSADYLNILFDMFRPSFLYMNLLTSSNHEHHQVAEFLLKEREMVQCYYWQRLLEGVNLQVLNRNQSKWETVRHSRLTEFCKKGAARKLRLHLKWRESSL